MSKSIAERFWSKVDRRGPNDCWLWTASIGSGGYGQLSSHLGHGPYRASRVSWELHFGPVPDGMCVLHRCDVRRCVNPGHLFIGTQLDNIADCVKKGRNGCSPRHGERNPAARLTVDEVLEIRDASGPNRQIARRFGVSQVTVSKIKRGVSWTHT